MILKISLIPITAQVSFDLHYSDIVLKGKKASNIKMNFYLVVLLVIIGKPGFCFYYLFVINQSYHTITSITVYSTCFYPFRPNLFFIHPSNWAIQMVRSLLFTKKKQPWVVIYTEYFILTEECSSPPACENGGFVNFQCQCVCPTGLMGATCTQIDGSKTAVTIYRIVNT